MYLLKIGLTLLLALCLTACLKPYRIDIQQGNLITDKEVARLKPGMTKREVRYVMGTPLVVDPFHPDRWDYVYSLRSGRSAPEQRRITLVFNAGEQLERVSGDVVAALEQPASVAVDEETGGTVVTEAPEKERKGFLKRAWEKIWGAGSDRDDRY